jgi:hypothetical protein
MKLVELVHHFRIGDSFEKFCKSNSLDLESEVVEVYMEQPFRLDNDLAFFEIEKTEGKVEYLTNGITYFNMFDFYHFLEVIEEYNKNENKLLSDNEIAIRVFDYAIHDA